MFLKVKESEEFVRFIRGAKFYTKPRHDSFVQLVSTTGCLFLDVP